MKASATVTPVGITSLVVSVAFLSTVFHGRKLGTSRTSDDGSPNVTPFMEDSLLKFVSATTLPSVDAFASRLPVCWWR